MPTYNSSRFLDAALNSVRNQTLEAIEIVVVDDASTDGSVGIARAHAAEDPRIRVIAAPVNAGPAAARNRALEIARGAWIAVFDSDDLMHPDRLQRLLGAALSQSADIVADDMLSFDDNGASPPKALLPPRPPSWIDLESYIRANVLYGRTLALGYLKPLIRAGLMHRHGIRYNESLRIGEDYDLVAQLLQKGARFHVVPELTYFYRRHGASISHRLSRRTIVPMQRAHDLFCATIANPPARLAAALNERAKSLATALAYDDVVAAAKTRNWTAAVSALIDNPSALPLLRLPLLVRLRRLLPTLSRAAPNVSAPSIVLLSRQRMIGATNGSSAYLLSMVQSLVQSGMQVHLVQPSPAVFGRWPVLAMRPEMGVFASIRIRGGLRVGRFVFATDLGVAWRAVLTIAERVLMKLRLYRKPRVRKAAYAVAVPWTRDDFLFVARHARQHADAVLADYAFLTEGLPYTLRPEAASAVVMHDLFSSRTAQFASDADSVSTLDLATEMEMLGRADAVIAIQADEAATVRRQLPAHTVLTAPMAIRPVDHAQPGQDSQLLFVGSNTAPNIVGLRWFIDRVWPLVRAGEPLAGLKVVGGVGDAFRCRAPGVEFLGRVDDLEPHYREAGVVISPLLQGSGLKIKLIEALGRGKAIVATPKTVQGVEGLVNGVLPVTDDAQSFAAEVLELLHDPALRTQRAEAALTVAREAFSATRCYETVNAFLEASVRSARAIAVAADTAYVGGDQLDQNQAGRRRTRKAPDGPLLGGMKA
jgi:succinoglycan biosynthesis protein ExoO